MVPSPGYIVGQDSVRIREGFRGSYTYLIFFCWTLFSVYLYSRYSTLGDSSVPHRCIRRRYAWLRTVVITR